MCYVGKLVIFILYFYRNFKTLINKENVLSDYTYVEIQTINKRKNLNDQNEFQEVLAKKEEEDYETDDKAEI